MALTTKLGQANAHKDIWHDYTSGVIKKITKEFPLVFLLFGGEAKKVKKYITEPQKHIIIETHHPSPIA